MTRTISFEQADELTGQLRHWAYNAADAAGTREIADALLPMLTGRRAKVYAFERAIQNPAFAMNHRGVLVDQEFRAELMARLEAEIAEALAQVDAMEIVRAFWDGTEKETGECPTSKRKDLKHTWSKRTSDEQPEAERICTTCGCPRFRPAPFNANSSVQVQHLLYDLMGIAPQKNKKGDISGDEEVLTRIRDGWHRLAPRDLRKRFPNGDELLGWEPDPELGRPGRGILHVRSLQKQFGEVKAPLTPDGRYLTTINIGAAWTGRSSSSKGYQGLGGNMQNKAERMRRMYIADRGYILIAADLAQAESLDVAYEAEDLAYIEAHKEDLHTYVTRILFPDLPWTGDMKKDKKIATATNPPWDPAPGHNWRFYTKRNSHGYNYGVSPAGTARIVHGKVKDAEDAHGKLDEAFPGIKGTYHAQIEQRVRAGLPIVTPLGREIQLLGRPWDHATFRQGYSASPQATVSDLVWIAAYNLYRDFDPGLLQLLGNGYDALLTQARREVAVVAMQAIKDYMSIPVLMPGGRTMTIGVELSFGANWGKRSKDNPGGQRDWNGTDQLDWSGIE